MTKTIPIRLREGLYEAVSEIAETLGMDKADTTGALVVLGLESVKPDFFSEKVYALIKADSMEASASLLRIWANLTPQQRKDLADKLGGLILGLSTIFDLGELTG